VRATSESCVDDVGLVERRPGLVPRRCRTSSMAGNSAHRGTRRKTARGRLLSRRRTRRRGPGRARLNRPATRRRH
jgi:hypothetical protein